MLSGRKVVFRACCALRLESWLPLAVAATRRLDLAFKKAEEVTMSEKRIGATDSTNVRPGKGVETHAVAAPFQKGQSASNLLGALAAKPAAGAGGGGGAGSSPAAEGTSKKS